MGHAGNQLADGRHFFRMDQLGLQHGGVGNVGEHDHDAGDDALLVAHGAEIHGELSDPPVATQYLQVEIVDGMSGEGGIQGVGQNRTANGRHELGQGTAHQLALLVTGVIPAAVGVSDQAGSIDHQNQTLGIVQNLFGKISGPLEFGLEGFQPGDVEHEAAILQHLAMRVGNREGINQDVNGAAILAPQHFFVIAQNSFLLHHFVEQVQPFRRRIELVGNINVEQLFAVTP